MQMFVVYFVICSSSGRACECSFGKGDFR